MPVCTKLKIQTIACPLHVQLNVLMLHKSYGRGYRGGSPTAVQA